MTQVCGEVADGLLAHAFTTRRYLDEVTIPALQRGLDRAGRQRAQFQVSGPVFVVTGRDEGEMAPRRPTASRSRSMPPPRLSQGCWNCTAGASCSPSCAGCPRADYLGRDGGPGRRRQMLGAFAVVAPIDKVAAALAHHCDGVLDRVLPGFAGGTRNPSSRQCFRDVRAKVNDDKIPREH